MPSAVSTAPAARPSRGPCHIFLHTNSEKFDDMVKWYTTVLGMTSTHHSKVVQLSLLTFDDEHHRVAITGIPGLPPRREAASGIAHVAFNYPSLRALLLAHGERKEKGVDPVWCTHHGMTISIYYADPDGNIIETEFDSMTPDECNAFMESDALAINPAGVDFVPEEYLARLDAGASEEEFKARPPTGPRTMLDVPTAMGLPKIH